VGSIEVGKYADFIVLDSDPRDVPADKIKEVRVLETWVNGCLVHEA
jgi:hypothetical protein